jgi:hypothetical protein
MIRNHFIFFLFFLFSSFSCSNEKEQPIAVNLQLQSLSMGPYNLSLAIEGINTRAPLDQPLVGTFSAPLDIQTITQSINLRVKNGASVTLSFSFQDDNKTFIAIPSVKLDVNQRYEFIISEELKGINNEVFSGITLEFQTDPGSILISSAVIDGKLVTSNNTIQDVDRNPLISISFSSAVKTSTISNATVQLSGLGNPELLFAFSEDGKVLTISTKESLDYLRRYTLTITNEVKGLADEEFTGYSKVFYTEIDSSPKFPIISDEELLTLVQQQTFKYFYDFAHPASGMARERNTSGDIVTSGGSGFGIMALIVGAERNFISRQQAVDRMKKIVSFLENADRFHGAWSHWINGNTGKVVPFSAKDNGGDLVETSFLVQGLITFRQYLEPTDTVGNNLINRITDLYYDVEWDWYRKNNEQVLYWHWSPNFNWEMNFPMYGYYEQQITYFLAAASPTHSIPKSVYTNGFGKNGAIVKNNLFYNIKLPLESPGPLFWVHYSYLGLDPHFSDGYANYWEQNVNATLINQAHCIANPRNYVGYSDACWGLTSSDNQSGYSAHSPGNDLGVITPTAALSSFPYTPTESMKALKFFYYTLGDRLWGEYGFYDSFNLTQAWFANTYLAIDQGPIIVMIENHRTGLLWDLFMSAPEVQEGFTKLEFTDTSN